MNANHKPAVKKVITIVCVVAALWIILCASLFHLMRQSPDHFARVMAKIPGPVPFLIFPFETLWTQARAGSLHVGDPAPNFLLTKLDKSASIQLSFLIAQKQPVVLLFGSYT
ncbi:MAG TPA: hypothetical protein VMD76_03165 [Candidatus Sulfotelmatobacter sp.]|nr:hypothetical protein [Candidatus Sulfotelmatobacter sp.]